MVRSKIVSIDAPQVVAFGAEPFYILMEPDQSLTVLSSYMDLVSHTLKADNCISEHMLTEERCIEDALPSPPLPRNIGHFLVFGDDTKTRIQA